MNDLQSQRSIKDQVVKQQPVWYGFHRDGLILIFVLDWVWAVLEFTAGVSLVGIPLILLTTVTLFAVGAKVVYAKQRQIGDTTAQATIKAICLGAIAGVPFPIFYSITLGVFALLNKAAPNTKGVKVKFPTKETITIGKFTSEYRDVEGILKRAVEKAGGDLKTEGSNVCKSVQFLQSKNLISSEVAARITEVRHFRNDYEHSVHSTSPNIHYLRLLRRCKEEIQVVLEDL